MAAPRPAPPAPPLGAALRELLDSTGARAVRVVDGRSGAVVGAAGDPPAGGGDDPATVAGLLRDAMALGRGGLDDVVVTTDRSMHVLRPAAVPGVFLHLRLGLDRVDVVRARRALAAPTLHAAIRTVLAPAPEAPAPGVPVPVTQVPVTQVPDPRGPDVQEPGPGVPTPRVPDPSVPDPRVPDVRSPADAGRPRGRTAVPAPRADPRTPAQQPALARLVVERAPAGHGIRAAGVLAELIEVAVPLPRRTPAVAARPAGVVTVGLPERVWARDVDTMRRLVLGLRRLT